MSKDNGIYILKTKDAQYRVKETQFISQYEIDENELIVVERFKDCKYTKNEKLAKNIAQKMNKEIKTEHGITELYCSKTWNDIKYSEKYIDKLEYR